MHVFLDREVCHHSVALGGTAPLSLENASQRRTGTAERGIADVMWHNRNSAAAQHIEGTVRVSSKIEYSHLAFSALSLFYIIHVIFTAGATAVLH
jgi:hypothetical protein